MQKFEKSIMFSGLFYSFNWSTFLVYDKFSVKPRNFDSYDRKACLLMLSTE